MSGTLVASIAEVTGSDDLYTLRLDSATGEGTLAVAVEDDDTIIDALSSPLGGPGMDNGVFASGVLFTVDRTAPTVALTSAFGDITNSGERIILTFNEPMPVLTAGMLTLTNLAVTDIVRVGDNGFNIGVQPQAQGACAIGIDPAAIADLAGNGLANGVAKTFTFDSIAPTVAFGSVPSEIARSSFALIDLTFSERPTGFSESDLVSNGTISQLTIDSASGRFRVSTPPAGDTLTITIPAGAFTDRAGNGNAGPVAVTIDLVPQFFVTFWGVF